MKKCILFLIIIPVAFIFNSCVTVEEHNKLKAELRKLQAELDECRNGAERLIALIDKDYKEEQYEQALRNIALLAEKHPESPKNKEYKELQITITEKLEKKRKLENVNNLGEWEINRYVDQFGDPTNEKYIELKQTIRGKFSNTATQDSPLNVEFLITNKNNISIMLYEYAGNNPVKGYDDSYTIHVSDKDGNKYKLYATNKNSDRMTLSSFDYKETGVTDSQILHNILLKGGTIKFAITERRRETTKYNFVINNADYYDNAYRVLTTGE